MNTNKRILTSDSTPRIPRWLIAAGIAVSLTVPLSASADHNGNGVVEVLASAAVAYVVIDAIGGFDDKNRGDRRHRQHDSRYWAHRDHRRHSRHDRNGYSRHGYSGYRNKHRRQHATHRVAHRYGSDHYRRHGDERRYRQRAYH